MYRSGGRDHGADFLPAHLFSSRFSPVITGAPWCTESSVFPECTLQSVCGSEGQALRLRLRPDYVAVLHYYGDKNKCTTLFNWSVGPDLEALLLVQLSSRMQRTKTAQERGQQRCIFSSNERSCSRFPQAAWPEPCRLRWPASAAAGRTAGTPALHIIGAIYSSSAERP